MELGQLVFSECNEGSTPFGAATLCSRRQIGMAQDYESCYRKVNVGSSPTGSAI